MTYNSDRLDRIETDLEVIKEIMLNSARRAEAADKRAEATDKRIEDMALSLQEQSRLANERNRIADERGQRIDEKLDRLTEKQDRTQQQLDSLREDVHIAFQTISLLSENTDRSIAQSRAEMAEFRTETRAIWDYLMRRSQNGGSSP